MAVAMIKDGYVLVRRPDHPRSDAKGYVREHILIAERALGRPLPPKVETHHFDRNGQHNANTNLVICENGLYHQLLHLRQRALAACGNPNWRKCLYCKVHDDLSRMTESRRRGMPKNQRRSPEYYHKSCARKYINEWRARRRANG